MSDVFLYVCDSKLLTAIKKALMQGKGELANLVRSVFAGECTVAGNSLY